VQEPVVAGAFLGLTLLWRIILQLNPEIRSKESNLNNPKNSVPEWLTSFDFFFLISSNKAKFESICL
jgi:hypothetical protein